MFFPPHYFFHPVSQRACYKWVRPRETPCMWPDPAWWAVYVSFQCPVYGMKPMGDGSSKHRGRISWCRLVGKGVGVREHRVLHVVNSMLKRRCHFVTVVNGTDPGVPVSSKIDMFLHSTLSLPKTSSCSLLTLPPSCPLWPLDLLTCVIPRCLFISICFSKMELSEPSTH